MIVAIDGPAGAGKSTTARGVAERLGYLYLDTGAMYRAVSLAVHRSGGSTQEEDVRRVLDELDLSVRASGAATRVFLDGEEVTGRIRTPEVSRLASEVSSLAIVREKMVEEQRRIGRERDEQGEGVVLDGRDIGTVVFPEADLKIFMIADARVRAQRRKEELEAKGEVRPLEEIQREIEERDRKDSERTHAPLRKADDAVELDTTGRTIDGQIHFVVEKVEERVAD